tara:strand:- start:1208 stop:2443 length:1236 start_codon:yes stop_codon:yes gene_type:complete
LNNNKFDIVGVSVIGGYYQYKKLLKISEAINKSKNRPLYIIGGHGPSPDPGFFLKKTLADVVVIGEGEKTIIKLIDAYGNRRSFEPIKGIAYRDGNKVKINEKRSLIKDIDTIPYPAYERFSMEYYRMLRSAGAAPFMKNSDFFMSMLSGRGCLFECNFCYRMDKGLRTRKDEYIIDEMKMLNRDYGITFISFADELLMSSVSRVESLCENIIKAKIDIQWMCNGRLNYAKPALLKLMKKAGCVCINYGVEAMDDLVLKNMNKGLTVKQVIKGVEATLDVGITPDLNITFGNIGDNIKTLGKGVEFLLKYDTCFKLRTIRPVTPYPGSPLYYNAIEKGLIKDCEDFYHNKHVNSDLLTVNFTQLSDEEFYNCLRDANIRLIKNYYHKKCTSAITVAGNLYINKESNFRGFR